MTIVDQLAVVAAVENSLEVLRATLLVAVTFVDAETFASLDADSFEVIIGGMLSCIADYCHEL